MRDKFCLDCFRHDTCNRCGDKILENFLDVLEGVKHDAKQDLDYRLQEINSTIKHYKGLLKK